MWLQNFLSIAVFNNRCNHVNGFDIMLKFNFKLSIWPLYKERVRQISEGLGLCIQVWKLCHMHILTQQVSLCCCLHANWYKSFIPRYHFLENVENQPKSKLLVKSAISELLSCFSDPLIKIQYYKKQVYCFFKLFYVCVYVCVCFWIWCGTTGTWTSTHTGSDRLQLSILCHNTDLR